MNAAARIAPIAPTVEALPEVPGARDRQREETRRRIYECALAIFRRDGLAASRIDDIARFAGVSRGAFYFHFPTKDDVLTELLRSSEKRVVDDLAVLPVDATVEDVLGTVCAALTAQWQDEPKLFAEVAMLGLRRTATSSASASEHDVLRAALTDRLRAAAERGELSAAMPMNVLADFFLANACAAALAWCANPVAPLDALLRSVVMLYLDGVRGVANPRR